MQQAWHGLDRLSRKSWPPLAQKSFAFVRVILDLQCDLTGGIGRLELGVNESRSFLLRPGVAAATIARVTVVASVSFTTRTAAFLLRRHRCAVNKCDELTFGRIPP